MRLSSAVEAYLAEIKHAVKGNTLHKYRGTLEQLKALAVLRSADNVIAFTPELTRELYLSQANKGLAPATLARMRSALIGFGKWCFNQRLIAESPTRLLPRLKVPQKLPRPFPVDARRQIMDLVLDQPDRLIRSLLFQAGLRVSEVSRLKVCDVDLDARHITIRDAKGGKDRVVPLEAGLWDLLREYMLSTSRIDQPASWVITRPNGERYTEQMIRARTRKWGDRLKLAKVTPHRFRHTFGTRLLDRGADLRQVQELMGHKNIATTARYTEVSRERLRAAVNLLSEETNPVEDSRPAVPEREES